MWAGDLNKKKDNDKSWSSCARSKDPHEPQNIINEHSADQVPAAKKQQECGRAMLEKGDEELEFNPSWIKGAGQNDENKQKYRKLFQDQEGPCEECG